MSAQCPVERQLHGHRFRGRNPLPESGLAPWAAPHSAMFRERQFAGEQNSMHNEQDKWGGHEALSGTAQLPFCTPLVLGGMTAFFANVQF